MFWSSAEVPFGSWAWFSFGNRSRIAKAAKKITKVVLIVFMAYDN
jgi:hypothetical protein